MIPTDGSAVVVFDLDDTLYKEIDFVRSGYSTVLTDLGLPLVPWLETMMAARSAGRDAFAEVVAAHQASFGHPPTTDTRHWLDIYRTHVPEITLESGARALIEELNTAGIPMAVVTDGRSVTQRNKLRALGVHDQVQLVVVSEEVGSEKPELRNFQHVSDAFPGFSDFTYIADNPRKDFVGPNQLGWRTIQLIDDGRNIHDQWSDVPATHRAHISVVTLDHISLGILGE